ncbi:MAG: hypothetical protein SPF99_07025, partial [Anaerobutyricum sp.]|nr:hypothetical protein [Anaerobutyricum sp.]
RIGDNTSKAADLAKTVDKKINKLMEKQQEITNMIRSLHDKNYIQVLYKVYVQFKTIKQAAVEMKRSYTYTLELHKKALAEFEVAYADILAI